MNPQNTLYYVNNWLVDVQSGSIVHQITGEQKRLGEYQLKLLEVLAQHAGEVLTREQLTSLVWEGRVIGNNSLPNAVHALRLALEDDGKNQRVIKTIPKRGYLLDKEYCSYICTNSDEAVGTNGTQSMPESEQDENAAIALEHESGSQLSVIHETNTFPNTAKPGWAKKSVIYSLFVLCLISIGISIYLYLNDDDSQSNAFTVRQVDTPKLKNIEVYHVLRQSQLEGTNLDPEKISERLDPALSELDQKLANEHSKMHVYYRAADAILNYAFTIENPCGRKELSMNIYHWWINSDRLNNLIRKETERKLNEAASCNN